MKDEELAIPLRASDLDLVVYDFDGVMTDNRVIVRQDGMESVTVCRADGLGVERVRELGIPQLILSTETNPVVRARSEKLRLEVIDSSRDKKKALEEYCHVRSYELARVLFVGNDVNDLEVMRAVGYPVAPRDAHPSILEIARFVTGAGGGEGVVREISDRIFE